MARRRERWFPYRIYDPDAADKDATDTHAAGRQKKKQQQRTCVGIESARKMCGILAVLWERLLGARTCYFEFEDRVCTK